MTPILPACCGTCVHFLPEVTDESEKEPTTGWCEARCPGDWLGWKKHKWMDGTNSVMVHAEGCCTDHDHKPVKQPAD
jgi:hypothetical protein